MMKSKGHQRLHGWFGLSYASFCVLPRVLMCEMPDAWQFKMAALLEEFQQAFPNQDHLPSPYVSARSADNRWTTWPGWLLNYRYPNQDEIERCRSQQCEVA